MRYKLTIIFFLAGLVIAQAQVNSSDAPANVDDLKKELILMKADLDNIQVNLGKSEKRFKRGIAVATLGYSVTIAGGLMLGRKQDDLGKALLVAGGVTGITGTILMVDAFKFLGRASRKKTP